MLSKSSLEPSLVYGMAFFCTYELEEEDIATSTMNFFKAWGLDSQTQTGNSQLARKRKEPNSKPVSRLLFAIKRTKRSLAKYLRTWVHDGEVHVEEEQKLIMANTRSCAPQWKPHGVSGPQRIIVFQVQCLDYQKEEKFDGDDDGYWSTGVRNQMGYHVSRSQTP
ncbi:uncharacterized protein LOC116118710 [Pistacia vera]|uniref:uncharacterized protein LOC116118710 n=1 Tax=Pistacia vera TaxID=55513 RepID=UPI0012634F43|nr:uncharacterized protein LOC116118710 [Pistacia vera]